MNMVRNAVAAFSRVASAVFHGREVLVPPAVFKQRMAACLKCENCIPDKNPQYYRCSLCGCFLNRKNKVDAKAWLSTERCPLPEPKWRSL
jgi:hypothetical protein